MRAWIPKPSLAVVLRLEFWFARLKAKKRSLMEGTLGLVLSPCPCWSHTHSDLSGGSLAAAGRTWRGLEPLFTVGTDSRAQRARVLLTPAMHRTSPEPRAGKQRKYQQCPWSRGTNSPFRPHGIPTDGALTKLNLQNKTIKHTGQQPTEQVPVGTWIVRAGP